MRWHVVAMHKLIAFIILALGAFGLMSFVEMSVDPTHWTAFARALFGFLLILVAGHCVSEE